MIWQDIVLMIGGFGFSLALIPAVRSKDKPPRSSCLMTGSILGIFAITYATLGLWLAFLSTMVTTGNIHPAFRGILFVGVHIKAATDLCCVGLAFNVQGRSKLAIIAYPLPLLIELGLGSFLTHQCFSISTWNRVEFPYFISYCL